MGAFDTGKSIADQILAKLPEGLRASVAPAFASPEAADALTLLGDTAMARADYSKQMDAIAKTTAELKAQEEALKTDHARLTQWWEENSPVVEDYRKIKPEYDRLKTTPNPNPDPPKEPVVAAGLTKEDIEKMFAERDAGYAGVLALQSRLTAGHFARFNEVLDVEPLIRLANEKHVSLAQAYEATHGERVKTHAAEVEKARIDKLVDEKMAERAKTSPLPFPIRGGGIEPSALDTLTTTAAERTARYTADSAADRYEQLVNAGGRGA